MCLLNPRVDLAFKKLFGSEENKNLLKSLVNSVMPPEEQIEDLESKYPYNLTNYLDGKLSVLHVKAVDTKGKGYDIKMQVEPLGYYGQKALFHWGKAFAGQIDSGELFSRLKKTIVISIIDFVYFPGDDRYHRNVVPLDTNTNERYDALDFMALHFVELKKFKKEPEELTTPLDRWAYFFNNAYKYEKDNIPVELSKDKEVKEAIEKLDMMHLNRKEREFYEADLKALRDWAEALRTAEEKGEKNKAIEMARNLKQNGVDISLIAGASGLSKEEIEKL